MLLIVFFHNDKLRQCGGSGMFIPDPEFRILIFTHPGSRIQKQQQKRGVKKICCQTFFCSYEFHKIKNQYIFEQFEPIHKELSVLRIRDVYPGS